MDVYHPKIQRRYWQKNEEVGFFVLGQQLGENDRPDE
jgi:hypothetical protein